MTKIEIGNGFSVDSDALEKYWKHIGDRLSDIHYRETNEIIDLERERERLHDEVVRSGGFDPEIRFKSDQEQKKIGFWSFNETLEDYIAQRLAKEGNIDALNRRVMGN